MFDDAIQNLGHATLAEFVEKENTTRGAVFHSRKRGQVRPINVLNKSRRSYLLSPADQEILKQNASPRDYNDYDGLIARIDPERSYNVNTFAAQCNVSRKSIERFVDEGMPREDYLIAGQKAIEWLEWRKNVYTLPQLAKRTGYGVLLLTGLLEKIEDESFKKIKLGDKEITYIYVEDIAKLKEALKTYRLSHSRQVNKFAGDMIYECLIKAGMHLSGSEFTLRNLDKLYVGINCHIDHRFNTIGAALIATADYIRQRYSDDPEKIELANRFSAEGLLKEKIAEKRERSAKKIKKVSEKESSEQAELPSPQPVSAEPTLEYLDLKPYLAQVVSAIAMRVSRSERIVTEALIGTISDLCASDPRPSGEEPLLVQRKKILCYDAARESELEPLVIEAVKKEFNIQLEKTERGYSVITKSRKKADRKQPDKPALQAEPVYLPLEDYLKPVASVIAKDIIARTKGRYIPDSEKNQKTNEILERLVSETITLSRIPHHDIDIPKDLITDKEGKPVYNTRHVAYILTLVSLTVNKQGYTLTVLGEGHVSVERK